ncbi:hypothetical protein M9Y10_024118 [Tritrichomonas musculus]|uniref:DUF3447 domain-containing protein n=1 Tax=Tritrichomonas musculus TaxID=1915356 RepID=A0ABR2KX69_9EUKA
MLIPPEIYAEIQELVELQEHLYDLCDQNYEEFLKYLSESPFLSNEDYVRKLLLCIYSAFRFNFKNTTTLCNVLVEIKDYLQKYLPSDEIVMNLRNNAARVALYECGIIDISSIFKDSHFNFFCFRFFYPELKAYDEKFYETMLRENRSLRNSMNYLAKDEARHKELRRLGKSEHRITQIIRNDDIDAFQEFISLQNFALTEQIPYSAYDTNDFANNEEKMPYLVECSAFYGSIKIFKYIFMSLQSMNIELPTTLPSFAVAGGNYDIIHIVEEHLKKNNNNLENVDRHNAPLGLLNNSDDDDNYLIDQRINEIQAILGHLKSRNQNNVDEFIGFFNQKRKELSSFSRSIVIQAAIEFHRNNVLDYIIENYSPKAEKMLKSAQTFNSCITFLNFYQMLEFLTSDEDKDKINSSEENTDDDYISENSDDNEENNTDASHDDDKNSNEDNNNNDNESQNTDGNKDDNDNVKMTETDVKAVDSSNNGNGNDNNGNQDDNVNVNNHDNNHDDNEINDDDHLEADDNGEEENKNEIEIEEPWVFDINLSPRNGLPPLIQSVFESRVDVVRFLLFTKDINVNITTHEGYSPLISAAMYGNLSIVKLLCEVKKDEIDFSKSTTDGSTALMIACSYGWLSIVQYLTSLKKSPKTDNVNGKDEDINSNNNNSQNDLPNKDDNKTSNDNDNDIKNEDHNDDSKEADEFVFDINHTNKRGQSSFLFACMKGHIEIVKFLASFPNIKMVQNGLYPDQIAEHFNHQNVVDFLNINSLYLKQKKEMEDEVVNKSNSHNTYPIANNFQQRSDEYDYYSDNSSDGDDNDNYDNVE